MTPRKHFLFFIEVMFFSYYFIEMTFAEEMACGKLNGHVIEVPRKYIAFWPEYEGKSSWEKGFIHNKKGCDANLTSLPMVMTWPGMMPANHTIYFVQALRFEGLSVTLQPLRRPNSDMRYLLEFFLSKTPEHWKENVRLDTDLGLFYVNGKDRIFSDGMNRYYWLNSGDEVPIVFECLWLPREHRLYTCEGRYVLKDIDTLVRISFTPEKITEWRSILNSVNLFVASKVKK
ncbi:hypothetical protein T3H00_26995 [Pseudomonas fluorescens]|uniref:hypothetical protein n=1 Tax=Pseudomonas fluorescens TaxID=294 RepID=UPI002ACA766E|nr:hypothetical protein [Pseudomonas fluorescens]MDZ5436300.1 hypothetical protein [Pseudomonas fluorescens]